MCTTSYLVLQHLMKLEPNSSICWLFILVNFFLVKKLYSHKIYDIFFSKSKQQKKQTQDNSTEIYNDNEFQDNTKRAYFVMKLNRILKFYLIDLYIIS